MPQPPRSRHRRGIYTTAKPSILSNPDTWHRPNLEHLRRLVGRLVGRRREHDRQIDFSYTLGLGKCRQSAMTMSNSYLQPTSEFGKPGSNHMKSPVAKRSIVIGGHKTSVSLEEAFWSSMKEIAGARRITLSDLVSEIDRKRDQGNLSSAIRLQVLAHYRDQMPPSDPPASRLMTRSLP